MIKSKAFVGLLLLFITTFSHANSLQEIEQLLASQQLVRGDFEQLRTMEMFSQPLTSSGKFVIHKEKGLLWHQNVPFPVNLVLTDNKLSQQFSGQSAQIMTEKENPMVFYFSHIFLSLFDGDIHGISEQFTVKLTQEAERWTLVLIPVKAPLNAVFSNIVISGSSYINQVKLVEIRGDTTTIHFSNQTDQPTTLTTKERAQFDF